MKQGGTSYYVNVFGEPIEYVGGIARNLAFWDCECIDDYIRSIEQRQCLQCSAGRDFMPPSREIEVSQWRECDVESNQPSV